MRLYRDVLGFEELTGPGADDTPGVEFGDRVLWQDRVATIGQAETWLEIVTDDVEGAAYLAEQGCQRRDEVKSLPDGFRAFCVSTPCNIIHPASSRL